MKPESALSIARFTLAALSVGVLVACGGDGGVDVADGGIRGTGSSVGPVSGFGSVFVNGVRFDTSGLKNEVVQSNDGITTEGDLDEGMILRVDGEWQGGEGRATGLEYDDTLRGPIVVDPNYDDATQTGKISVLGLTVIIDRQTVVKGSAQPVVLSDGDVVRVSGWRLQDGQFRASLVRVHSDSGDAFGAGNEIELEGRIDNYDAVPCSFDMGSVTVDCNSLNAESPLNPDDLNEGVIVEVEGSLNLQGDQLNAAEIRQDDQRRYRRGGNDDIEFSGPVSDGFDDATDSFRINGLTVNVTAATEFVGDLTEAELVSGLLIQVEGDYQSNGTIDAEEIELREANAKVEGRIDEGADPTSGSFSVGGVQVQITSFTLIEADEDDSDLPRDELFERLAAGDEVEIEGIERRQGSSDDIVLEALKIEIEEEEDGEAEGDSGYPSFELEGKLRAIDSESISILGLTIKAPATVYDDTNPIELAGLIQEEQSQYPVVEVDYVRQSVGVFEYLATEIEKEDDDDDDDEDD